MQFGLQIAVQEIGCSRSVSISARILEISSDLLVILMLHRSPCVVGCVGICLTAKGVQGIWYCCYQTCCVVCASCGGDDT